MNERTARIAIGPDLFDQDLQEAIDHVEPTSLEEREWRNTRRRQEQSDAKPLKVPKQPKAA